SQNAHLSPDKRGASRDGLNTLTKQFKKPGASKHASVVVEAVHKLSNRQYEQVLKESYVNIRRAREWRDIYSQLHTVVAEQGWTLNQKPAGYESLHLSLLAGLLGNVGCKNETEDWYLGARGIKFLRHPGANLSKKPGKWIVVAELVQTTRLFGRGIAQIDPKWLEEVGGHLLKKQLLEPHWEKKSAHVVALERATLYGLVVYNQRRIRYDRIDPVLSRTLFIREGLVGGAYECKLPFLAANRRMMREVLDLEHKSRRQDVLVDDSLIEAYYDAQLPDDVFSGDTLERWYRVESKRTDRLLFLDRESLMRHEASGVTHQAFPKVVRVGGVDCVATYLHEPGDSKDGLTVEVPIFALNQVDAGRCEWLVPGMLKDKIQALLKSLPQRPRSRLVPIPHTAESMAEVLSAQGTFGNGSLTDAVVRLVREKTQLDVKAAEFKADMLSPHLLMNIKVVDETGRQLGMGRQVATLKANLGGKARGAFQALAQLKLGTPPASQASANEQPSSPAAGELKGVG
ncbi:MAG: DUF3418 domain-containing protein, partial [Burkholderiaceae bacterium]